MAAHSLDPVELGERASAALALRHHGARVRDLEQILGGTSSLTYAATMISEAGTRRIVIKAAPPGLEPVRNRDVLRQARVLGVLAGVDGVAVPDVLASDPGASVEVPPFFVMSFVAGESYEPLLERRETAASEAEVSARARAAARMAARLHAVDTRDARFAGERVTDLEREVGRWAKAFASVEDDLRPGADAVRDRLLAAVPAPTPPALLHGDWRLGNMQCNGGRIDAVIDWEIWSLGDRRLDLAWFLLLLDEGRRDKVRELGGLPGPGELVAEYEDASGTDVVELAWFEALVRYKQAAAAALIVKNNRKLPQPGVDVERMASGIPQLLDWSDELLAQRRHRDPGSR